MKVIEIVSEYLTKNSYDGLVLGNGDCSCEIEDLAPCDNVGEECRAGYKHTKPDSTWWIISTSKTPPTAEEWEKLDYTFS